MSEYTVMLLEVLISIAVAVLVRYAVPYLKALTDNEKFSALIDIIAVAVNAAEQTIRESGQGKVKKAQVLAFVSAWLEEKGMNISEDTLDRLIEAAVRAMNMEKTS